MFGAEPRVNYNRIMLSPVLSGEKAFEDIIIHDEAWYAKHGVESAARRSPSSPSTARPGRSRPRAGEKLGYDKLVIATGSQPFVIPVPGANLKGVVTFRDLDDVALMHEAAEKGGHAVVIGGGLLGLEAAAGLALKGMKVSVVHLMPTLMERQLDPSAGYLLQKSITERGIDVYTAANTEAILGETEVTGVKLEGRPRAAGRHRRHGGRHPPQRRTGQIGRARLQSRRAGRRPFAHQRSRTSTPSANASNIAANATASSRRSMKWPRYWRANWRMKSPLGFTPTVTSTKLKVTGIDLFSAGDFSDDDANNEVVLRDPSRGVYKRVVLRDNKVVGAVLYGDTADGAWYFDLLKKGEDVGGIRDTLDLRSGLSGRVAAGPYGGRCSLAG